VLPRIGAITYRVRLALALAVALSVPTVLPGQDAARVQLSGYIRDAASREVVRYAIVTADNDSIQTLSNADGFYFLNLTPGPHRVRVRAIGYAPLDTTVVLAAPRTLDFEMVTRAVMLQRVQVSAEQAPADVDPASPQMSIARLDLATVRQAPAALGEIDPIRSITLLPGVTTSSDFSTAFSVRGGTSDQNLILLDEATIYNPAHVLGFLSVFNSDAVADVTLHKGAIPARFGGRLSSVLDVRQREGTAEQFQGSASIGLLASRLLMEGPLGDRGSWLVAGRRSYADVFLALAPDTSIRDSRAYFYDLNAKTNVTLGENGTVMASAYLGRDLFSPSADFEAGWGNRSATLRWNQIVSQRLFSKVSYTGGTYDYLLGFTVLDGRVDWRSYITSHELRLDESYHLSERSVIEFGGELARQSIRPGDLEPRDTTKLLPIRVARRQGVSTALHASHVLDIGNRLSVSYGLRFSTYARRAPATVYEYADGRPVRYNPTLLRFEPSQTIDSTYQGSGNIASFSGLEPRVSLRVAVGENASVKASYARTRQYLLLASRTNNPTPLDVWEPVGPWVKPQHADQVALGYAATLRDGGYELSVESYFKRSYNVLDFVPGSDVILNPQIESALLQGVGRSYGLEVLFRKYVGDWTGWVSYTLGRAEQRFVATPGAGINNGAWFPSPSDKTHDVSIVATRPLGVRWTLGTTFSFATGLPVTYPVSRYVIDDLVVPEYGARNSSRLPPYHRLDVSLTRVGERSELQIGVFNLYNRFNAQSMRFRQSEADRLHTEAVQLSVFGIVPSISYTRKFR